MSRLHIRMLQGAFAVAFLFLLHEYIKNSRLHAAGGISVASVSGSLGALASNVSMQIKNISASLKREVEGLGRHAQLPQQLPEGQHLLQRRSPVTAQHQQPQQPQAQQLLLQQQQQSEERRAAETWVARRLLELQHPADCASPHRKFVVCEADASMSDCGVPCILPHFASCLKAGLATGRNVIVDASVPWKHAHGCDEANKWNCFFMPVSSCTREHAGTVSGFGGHINSSSKAVLMTYEQSREYAQWIPEPIKDSLQGHSAPHAWVAGVVSAYLLRFNEKTRKEYETVKQQIGFTHPILGVNGLSDESESKAALRHLNDFLRQAPQNFTSIFLAADDKTSVRAMMTAFSDHRFVTMNSTAAENAKSLLFDISLLSECDFFFGSDSSQISHVVRDLMHARLFDASKAVWLTKP